MPRCVLQSIALSSTASPSLTSSRLSALRLASAASDRLSAVSATTSLRVQQPAAGPARPIMSPSGVRALRHVATSAVAEEQPPAAVAAPLEDEAEVELKRGIAAFYDESSGVWVDIWGEHMHHGYYPTAAEADTNGNGNGSAAKASGVDHFAAQVEMIERVLAWATAADGKDWKPSRVVDVGCGVGGSARHIARRYGEGTAVDAITLSPWQAAHGNQRCTDAGLDQQVRLQVADAMAQPFADGSFDLVWSLESGEHMPRKPQFVQELARVTAPGGRIIIVTWCHRDLLPGETQLKDSEQALLQRVCDAYYLPAWCSPSDYVQYAKDAGLQNIRTADWTENISLFWPAVMKSAFTLKGIWGLLTSGSKTLRGAVAMLWMMQGYHSGLIKFALITASKPQ